MSSGYVVRTLPCTGCSLKHCPKLALERCSCKHIGEVEHTRLYAGGPTGMHITQRALLCYNVKPLGCHDYTATSVCTMPWIPRCTSIARWLQWQRLRQNIRLLRLRLLGFTTHSVCQAFMQTASSLPCFLSSLCSAAAYQCIYAF